MRKRWYIFAAAVLMALGLTFNCVAPRPARGPDFCAGADAPCLTRKVCVFDRAGSCEVCRCESPAFYPPGQEPGAPGSHSY